MTPSDRRRLLRRTFLAALALGLAAPGAASLAQPRRVFRPADVNRVRDVDDPERSPDGRWVAYTVRTADTSEDRQDTDIWMTSWDGTRTVRLTSSRAGEHAPRWSPDGRWLAFLSSRGDPEGANQLWLLDRAGGEAERATSVRGGIGDYAWSPDGARVVLVASEPDSTTLADEDDGIERPIVIDRFRFKEDGVGYLGAERSHLWLLDIATRATTRLTSGASSEALPAWSPDGRRIAYSSSGGSDVDRTDDWNLFVIEAREGAAPRRLTTFDGPDQEPSWESRPAWSPDGRWIAYLRGGAPKLIYYAVQRLAVVGADGGAPHIVTASLDRNVASPWWSADGRTLYFLLEGDRVRDLARLRVANGRAAGAVERVTSGRHYVSAFSPGSDGSFALLESTTTMPDEIVALDGIADARGASRHDARAVSCQLSAARCQPTASIRRLTHVNDAFVAGLALARTEEISFRSRDGTEVHGFVTYPPDYVRGRRYPTVLRIHGGPVSQFANAFSPEWQMLAAAGYVVVAANPRGSSGRGEAWSTAIYADWGNRDGDDVLAAVDWAIAHGIADPARLGVGGWSYGAILTNYVITRDHRFRAATSGAGISNFLAGYGTDQYVREYETELGTPWRNPSLWLRLSSPFLHADRITTPTLFLCGEKDANVPAIDSEQMYQALRSLGVATRLVIYPGQYHGLSKPSYLRDRFERYVGWYDRYLKGGGVVAAGK